MYGTVEQNKKWDVVTRFVSKKSLLHPEKGSHSTIKLIGINGATWLLSAEVLLDVLQKLHNVPYRSCPYVVRMYGDLRYG